MDQQQIFQLKLAALDVATRPSNTDTGTAIEKAQAIYDFLTAEVAKPENKVSLATVSSIARE